MAQNNPQSTSLARRPEPGLARWTPSDDFHSLRRQMDDLFARAFGYTPLSQLVPGDPTAMEPDIEMHETEDKVQVYAALPGYTPDQIQVEATGDTLTIRGERTSLAQDDKSTQQVQGRVTGASRFSATIRLPAEIDPNKIQATFRNGVLQLDIPKAEQAKPKKVKVNVEAQK